MKKCIIGLFILVIYVSCSKSNDQPTSSSINIDHLTRHDWVLDSGVITFNGMRDVSIPDVGERWAAEFTADKYIIKINNETPQTMNYLFKAKDTVFYWETSGQLDPDQYFLIKTLTAEKLITSEREQISSAMVETHMHAE